MSFSVGVLHGVSIRSLPSEGRKISVRARLVTEREEVFVVFTREKRAREPVVVYGGVRCGTAALRVSSPRWESKSSLTTSLFCSPPLCSSTLPPLRQTLTHSRSSLLFSSGLLLFSLTFTLKNDVRCWIHPPSFIVFEQAC